MKLQNNIQTALLHTVEVNDDHIWFSVYNSLSFSGYSEKDIKWLQKLCLVECPVDGSGALYSGEAERAVGGWHLPVCLWLLRWVVNKETIKIKSTVFL